MLSQCLLPSVTKKIISYLLILRQQPFRALQKQNFHWDISIFLKNQLTYFLFKILYSNGKNTSKPGQTFDMTTDYQIEKY